MMRPGPQPITAERLRKLFDYSPDTGHFTRRSNAKRAGYLHRSSGYWVIKINSKGVSAHRLVWLYMTGEWPEDLIDHINREKLDNRFVNLREATYLQNSQNSICTKSETGYRGVHREKRTKKLNKWFAVAHINGKQTYLGICDTPEEAAQRYLDAKKSLHGEFVPNE